MPSEEARSTDDNEAIEREDRDLGFGAVIATESERRLLNHDGSFNVERHGLGWRSTLSLYHSLLEMSWPRFTALALAAYLAANLVSPRPTHWPAPMHSRAWAP